MCLILKIGSFLMFRTEFPSFCTFRSCVSVYLKINVLIEGYIYVFLLEGVNLVDERNLIKQ